MDSGISEHAVTEDAADAGVRECADHFVGVVGAVHDVGVVDDGRDARVDGVEEAGIASEVRVVGIVERAVDAPYA
jgi:hypothetical protein